ncbi:hypothetical protein ACFQVC_40970 [Streptomyces monticola]|uniref:Uncharacterized protein n=1 Tax=Streptomyces monticola TaxID=2666263 RepID=A0ABW2JX67_9ACTN
MIAIAVLAVITFGVGDVVAVGLALVSVLVLLAGRQRARHQVRRHLASLASVNVGSPAARPTDTQEQQA